MTFKIVKGGRAKGGRTPPPLVPGKLKDLDERKFALRRFIACAKQLGFDTIDEMRNIAKQNGLGNSLSILSALQLNDLTSIITKREVRVPYRASARLEFRVVIPEEKLKMMGKLSALLAGMAKTWEYADGVAKKMYETDFVEWLSPDRLHSVIGQIEQQKRRETNRIIE